MFYSYFERKNYKALTFNIVNFANFEGRPSNKRRTLQFQNLISARGAYYKKYGKQRKMIRHYLSTWRRILPLF